MSVLKAGINRDKYVLDSIMSGATIKSVKEKIGVSDSMVRQIFFRQVKSVMPELFIDGNPTLESLKLISDEIKEKIHRRLVNLDVNHHDVKYQVNDAIRLLVDVGYVVTKAKL